MADDPTFAWRAPIGIAALVVLAAVDRRRTGRWDRARELAFLFSVAAAAMPDRPRLPYATLAGEAARVLALSLALSLGLSLALPFSSSLANALAPLHLDVPRYLAAQGAHLGSYVGLALALPNAWRRVRRARTIAAR